MFVLPKGSALVDGSQMQKSVAAFCCLSQILEFPTEAEYLTLKAPPLFSN